ncbi:hypothetical protein BBJ29_006171 [Phytophthora kernoviae]|uniref:Myb-like domain-containing protein n=1 Tax=Phytophthora kernoviae TaxID=325452 RepID=A0A3F2RUG8_9STRA|nr:hypothetical protein BBJ29_006171 [Phytophthora kernoviae]RLN64482.1 hypothetical protein BBP00_00003431 [Phytophthora kernoviae]
MADELSGAEGETETVAAPWNVRIHEKRRKAFRFQTASDIVLLRQVMARTPWSCPHGETGPAWDAVAGSFKVSVPRASVDGRACRRRYLALLEAYRTGKLHQLRGAAGTPAVHTEREQLLARCQFNTDDYRRRKTTKGTPTATVGAVDNVSGNRTFDLSGSEAGEASATPQDELRPFSAPQDPRTLPLNDPRVLLRQRELELEDRRLRLEEQRFEQQRQVTERQLEMMAAQTTVLLKLAEKLTNPSSPS